jgi:hypothetical protein
LIKSFHGRSRRPEVHLADFLLRILSQKEALKILNNDEQILKVFLAIFAGKFNSLEAM